MHRIKKPSLFIRGAPSESTGGKWNVFGRISLAFYAKLPVERRNWMDNPKPEFLWVFAADKTPSHAQTLSILLKPLGESDFEAFFFSPTTTSIVTFLVFFF